MQVGIPGEAFQLLDGHDGTAGEGEAAHDEGVKRLPGEEPGKSAKEFTESGCAAEEGPAQVEERDAVKEGFQPPDKNAEKQVIGPKEDGKKGNDGQDAQAPEEEDLSEMTPTEADPEIDCLPRAAGS